MSCSPENEAAHGLGRPEEQGDEARRRDALLREFTEKERREANERDEKMRSARETPVTYDGKLGK